MRDRPEENLRGGYFTTSIRHLVSRNPPIHIPWSTLEQAAKQKRRDPGNKVADVQLTYCFYLSSDELKQQRRIQSQKRVSFKSLDSGCSIESPLDSEDEDEAEGSDETSKLAIVNSRVVFLAT